MRQVRVVLIWFCLLSGLLWAAAGDRHAFELEWQENGVSDRALVELGRKEPFAKEPDFGQRTILRGTLGFLTLPEESGLGFAWDKSEGKLYVDLNRDGDLTNDPNGVLQKEDDYNSQYTQQFPPLLVCVPTDRGVFRYMLKPQFCGYDWRQWAEIDIASGYAGTVELDGNPWNIGVNDRFEGCIGSNSKMMADSGGEDLTNAITSLPVPRSIFLGGTCYEMAFEFRKADRDTPALWCTLTEKEVPLGTLRIEGNSVSQLVFGDDDMLILPALKEEPVSVPVGDYRLKACSLKYHEDRPPVSPQRLNEVCVQVLQEGEGVFEIGAPLQNSVRVQRNGKILTFNYELKGAGGETYDAQQINNYDRVKKPSVAIYKGDMQVGSGEFEYG